MIAKNILRLAGVPMVALPLLTGCVADGGSDMPAQMAATPTRTTPATADPAATSMGMAKQVVTEMVVAKLQQSGLPYTATDLNGLVGSVMTMIEQGRVDLQNTAQLALVVTDLVIKWGQGGGAAQ